MKICDESQCCACGMCSNICPCNAITMQPGQCGFLFPRIDVERCINCGLCRQMCPAHVSKKQENTMFQIYAAWNKDAYVRKRSTSGGIFGIIAKEILENNGAVIGARWDRAFGVEHSVALTEDAAKEFRYSKYVQSKTGNIYSKTKELLEEGKEVLFSGTPCQVHALKVYLGKEYDRLFTIDLVCHGVPSENCLKKYLNEISNGKKINNIYLRYKSPYWDYSNVRIEYDDDTYYQNPTVDDPYFSLFNIGFSLRESCHNCKYTSLHREGDITLADFWGYRPNNFTMRNFLKGVSLVAINTKKGLDLFDKTKKFINFEPATLQAAKASNKSFSEPYTLPRETLNAFWEDYEAGVSLDALCKKYVKNPFKIPKMLCLRRLVKRYNWIFKR